MNHIQITAQAVAEAVAIERKKSADEIERLRARMARAHDALTDLFWEGGIDQEDSRKVQGILRGDDEKTEQNALAG